jgi:uncharacterized protein YndB with AHSA1/START domain
VERPTTRSIALRVPLDEVWGALTDPARLSEWFGVRAEIDPRPGGAVRFDGPGEAVRRGLVETADPPRRLVFRWRTLRGSPAELVAGRVSTVEFLLEPNGEGTNLVVTESPGILTASEAGS